jgi:hypothetical protein
MTHPAKRQLPALPGRTIESPYCFETNLVDGVAPAPGASASARTTRRVAILRIMFFLLACLTGTSARTAVEPRFPPRVVVFSELGYSEPEAEGASMRERSVRAYLQLGAVAILALVLAAVAAAKPGTSQLHVTLTDGKLVVSPKSFTAGPVTFVVVNKGKLSHALAVFGAGKLKRTPTLKPDGSTKLTVQTSSGKYKVWDPVRSSLSHALVVTAKPAPSSTSSSSAGDTGGTVVGGSTGGSLSNSGTKTCLPGQNSDMYDASNATCPPGSTGPGATTTTTTAGG